MSSSRLSTRVVSSRCYSTIIAGYLASMYARLPYSELTQLTEHNVAVEGVPSWFPGGGHMTWIRGTLDVIDRAFATESE